jgi:hypothetical protein
LATLSCASLALACSVGTGEGTITGSVLIEQCRLDEADFDLRPSFFAAEFINDPELIDPVDRLRRMNIRIQRGSGREADSDGLMIAVRDVNEIEAAIDAPIAIVDEANAMVELTLYLNQQCQAGLPRGRWTRSAILPAVSGTIRFSAIYAPGLGDEDGEITATFDDVAFVDPADPEGRNATLSGAFTFVYQRGSPAQRFP